MTTNIVCEYCDIIFISQKNLNIHQKSSKKCLHKRGIFIDTYTCNICSKTFSNYNGLKRHEQNTCKKNTGILDQLNETKSRLDEKIKQIELLTSEVTNLKIKIKELKNQNQNLKCALSQEKGVVKGIQIAPAKTVTNRVHYKLAKLPISSVPPFNTKTIQAAVKSGTYTKEMFEAGMNGLLDCFKEIVCEMRDDGICEKNYVCTDSSRKKFHRLLKTRQWQEDDGGHYLTRFFDCLKDKATIYFHELVEEVKNARNDVYNAEDKKDECVYENRIDKSKDDLAEDNYYLDGLGDKMKCKDKAKLEYYKLCENLKNAEKTLLVKKNKLDSVKVIYKGIIGIKSENRYNLLDEFRNNIKSLYAANDFGPLVESMSISDSSESMTDDSLDLEIEYK